VTKIKQTSLEKINDSYFIKIELHNDIERYFFWDNITNEFIKLDNGFDMEDVEKRLRTAIASYLNSIDNQRMAQELVLMLPEFVRLKKEEDLQKRKKEKSV
jgi:hypothetical protein